MPKIIHIKDSEELLIDGSDNLLIFIDTDVVNIRYEVINKNFKAILINNANDLVLNDCGYIKDNSNVEIYYIDLLNNDLNQKSKIEVYDASELHINAKYLSSKNKNIDLNYINKDKYTSVYIDNSCVCAKDGIINLKCTGKIEKGAKASKNHQSSRCLTLNNPKSTKVEPILLIDENDVEASHSLSSGTIDEDVMFYLHSRGLTNNEAMVLYIHSYLIPDISIFEGFENGEDIIAELEGKVSDLYA